MKGQGGLETGDPVIVAEQVRHSYDGRRFALDGVSFTVARGEVFGLLGRNGAGKSTLIKAMTTLIQPTSGRLRVLGHDPRHDGRKIRERIGVVQQGESFEFTTVEGNLDLYGFLWKVPRAERRRRAELLIERFGLGEFRRRRSFDISGGQKRRVQVAREFMHDMDILFLDEPTIGLDVLMRRVLLDSIRAEVRRGLTVVFTTHNLEEADYLCDRVAVIDEGRLLAMDTVANLKRLYSGKKTVDLSVGAADAPRFFAALQGALGPAATITVSGSESVLLVDDPKEALSVIVQLAQRLGVQIEWLTVRQNTLEDVFLRSIDPGRESRGGA
ncbi:MAG TPA: ABC transporter ATP-binding protein [Thermoplasmata archaeon]|nr:ABC transporter ATP-binding protein [Thermoplasmata archaeon]